jgi:hypothetical protein
VAGYRLAERYELTMIVTEDFVYIHVSRSGGTFLNKLIHEQFPGARMIQYHGQLRDLPEQYADLPVIGFVRNPWDWYVSMFFDYQRKKQFVHQVLSERGTLRFQETVSRFLRLGDNSAQSKRLLDQLVSAAPAEINPRNPAPRQRPGLRSAQFAEYPKGVGYYSWLFQLMFDTDNPERILIGRFENLRKEALRLFEEVGAPITKGVTTYLETAKPMNPSARPPSYTRGYSPELRQLVADRDSYVIDRYGYEFKEVNNYPKAELFRRLGSVDVDALIARVASTPESQWASENEDKPNKFARLNDTSHIVFRFIESLENLFDFYDHPVLWDEWKDLLLPIMESAAGELGYKDYRFPRVMLARLPAGGEISEHTDRDASQYIHKIHVPLVTNPETRFRIGRHVMQMPVGEMIEVNNKRNHAVKNDGACDRIHLIFECYNVEDYNKPS